MKLKKYYKTESQSPAFEEKSKMYMAFHILSSNGLKVCSSYQASFLWWSLLSSTRRLCSVSGSSTKVIFFLIYIKLFILFIYFWLRWVFIAARGLSLVAPSGGYSSLWCVGFSLWWLFLLWSAGFRCVGFSSCGIWAQ